MTCEEVHFLYSFQPILYYIQKVHPFTDDVRWLFQSFVTTHKYYNSTKLSNLIQIRKTVHTIHNSDYLDLKKLNQPLTQFAIPD